MKRIALFGSTGSIGRQTLNVARRNPDKFKIEALYAYSSNELLDVQAIEFNPSCIALGDESKKDTLKYSNGEVFYGTDSIEKICSLPDVDLVVVAVVGMSGLEIVLSALKNKKTVALANKESLVAGGQLIKRAQKETDGIILPIDSEHSAVWQCLSDNKNDLKRIILTASGGPFRGYNSEALRKVSVEEALNHPNWKMGKKVSIDSATMMNKALEIIEARWLFDTENVDYIIHPQSIIHSLVEFKDGSIIAQMAIPNMEIPISFALSYPQRLENPFRSFDFDRALTFEKPDETVFKAPSLAYNCLKRGGNAACALNAANEAAVKLFLDKKINFVEIVEICEEALKSFKFIPEPSLGDLHDTYNEVYNGIIFT